GQESSRIDQAADSGRRGESVAAGGAGARPARRQHHGVLQGLQRPDPEHAGPAHPGDRHRVRRPLVYLRHQEPARVDSLAPRRGNRKGLADAEQEQGRKGHPRAGRGNRQNQAQGPDRGRPRRRRQHRLRHRAQHGHRRYRLRLNKMAGKKYNEAAKKIDREKRYTLEEAVKLVVDNKLAKFDETVEIAVRLGVDPRQADQNVRGTIVLPHGTGSVARVLVVAKGEKEREAREAGADFVGGDEIIKKIQEENWLDFDRVIATPDMMGQVGRIGKILGPRGLMPNPKVGTVTFDVAKAVAEIKAGK